LTGQFENENQFAQGNELVTKRSTFSTGKRELREKFALK
jgi:hypothetical protein